MKHQKSICDNYTRLLTVCNKGLPFYLTGKPANICYNVDTEGGKRTVASNSDSIYNVLTYIHRHQDRVRFIRQRNSNVIAIGVPDTVPVANPEIYFPVGHLLVNRMDNDFLAKHGELLNDFFARTNSSKLDYQEVWITTSYIKNAQTYLVELSFE